MPTHYFGTDGIRGPALTGVLSTRVVKRFGAAIGVALIETRPLGDGVRGVVVGRDTRASGPALAEALTDGLTRNGFTVWDVGVLPTAAVARLVRQWNAVLGVVISASHNPPGDNGIKLFTDDGTKAPESFEAAVEAIYDDLSFEPSAMGRASAAVPRPEGQAAYVDALVAELGGDGALAGMRVLVDGANGAASIVGPEVFQRLGAEVIAHHVETDGARINVGCGAMHPEFLAQEVLAESGRIDLGITFDGDADRTILVDERGAVCDGDHMLAIWGLHLHTNGGLPGETVVSTSMANLGLERALARNGLHLERTDVGDKYVAARMRERGFALGGEQSGHVLYFGGSPEATTGDGLLTAGNIARIVGASGGPLSALSSVVEKYPQVLLNVRVDRTPPFVDVPGVLERVDQAEHALGVPRDATAARIVLRYSGTEPLARVMIEGADAAAIASEAEGIAAVIRTAIGA